MCALLQSSKQNWTGRRVPRPSVSLPSPPSAVHISPPSSPPLSLSLQALTCIQEERGNGKWIGKTSQPCPPSSSTNDSERLQKITEGAQSIHSGRVEDGHSRGLEVSFLCGPHGCPPGRKAFDQTSLLSTMKSTINHPHWRGRRK